MMRVTRWLKLTCLAAALSAVVAPPAALAGDILIDPCSYDDADQARAVWTAVDDTPAVKAVEAPSGGRRMLGLPCDFVSHPAMKVARWQRALKVDLTGRPGVRVDLYCRAPDGLERIELALLDEHGRPVARGSVAPRPGWNTLAATAPTPMDPATAERWAAIASLQVSVHPARRVSVAPAIADLRVIGPDPLISLVRLEGHDCITPRHGERLTGAIRTETFRVNTLFGPVDLPAARVVGLETVTVGDSGVRVLLTDGQVVSGALTDTMLRFELTGGELMLLPVGRLRQCAFAISPHRPAWAAPQGPVARIGGGRLAVRLAEDWRFALQTPHGTIALPAELLARIEAMESGRWKATLRSGSVLIGTPAEPSIAATWLAGPEDERPITVTTAHVRQLRWPVTIEPPTAAAEARLADDQVLYGQIDQPTVTVKGEFGAEAVDVDDIVAADFSTVHRPMATLTLYGARTKRAAVLDETVAFRLLPDGPALPLRVDRLVSIHTAGAQSRRQFTARIDRLVRDLDAPDEADRRQAHRELLRIGPAAAPLLRQRLGNPNAVIRRTLLEILADLG